MSSTNAFLKDFIEMRKSITPNTLPNLVSPNVKDTKNGVKVKKQKPPVTQNQETSESTLAKIIEEKPPKKNVIAYLQTFANELTIQKMK